MGDETAPEISADISIRRSWHTVFEGRSGDLVIAAIAIAFCLVMFYRGTTVWQFNDTESAITIEEAESITRGFHRWGLLEYTHHPIGRAYLLIPLVLLGAKPLILLPIAVSVAATTLALLALLYQASGLAMRSYVLILFVSLLWQPGFVGWLGNLHQHSYNMSSILLIIALGASLRGAAMAFGVLGFVCGWIGYDVFIPQIFTAATVRMAFYGRDPRIAPWYAGLRSAGDAAAFGAAFLASVLLHFVQNMLYFSSASMAYWDFFGSLGVRINFPLHERLAAAIEVAGHYCTAFTDPMLQWSNPPLLWTTLSLFLLAAVYSAIRIARADGATAFLTRRWWLLPLCSVGAIGTVFGWFLVAPRHAAPHLHLFPRMLFVPILVFSAAVVLVLSKTDSPPPKRGETVSLVALVSCALMGVALIHLPVRSYAAVDRRFFESIWINPTADVRTDLISSRHLASETEASSVAPFMSVAAPVILKSQHRLVGDINFWGEKFDLDPRARWSPDPSVAGEAWFEQRFEGAAEVTDIALRFWGLPKFRGAHTPVSFEIRTLPADGDSPVVVAVFPGEAGKITMLGKYLCVHYQLSHPVKTEGLRLVFGDTVGGGPPLMSDFLAFGTTIADGDGIPPGLTQNPAVE